MAVTTEFRHAFNHYRAKNLTAERAFELATRDGHNGKAHYTSSPWNAPRFPMAIRMKSKPDYYVVQDENAFRTVIENTGQNNRRDSHNGYYTGPDQDTDNLCIGVVIALPHGKFYPGYRFTGMDGGPVVDFSAVYDDKDDAARPAESMAEYAAEEEREYQTAWQAGSAWASEKAELEEAKRDLKALLIERRKVKGTEGYPALCAAIRGAVRSFVRDIEEARTNMRKLKSGDHKHLGFYPDDDAISAFNEGAGLN
jgi:hypothetical protein